ncbi:MAG: ABC transporter permease [Bacteroidetes bacterium]|nr:ABC transporter permease [Bacteroidota bacterium]
MLQNYLKIAFRNIRRNKVYSFINIVGLAIGMASCIVILLYVQYEFSFDRFNMNYKRIYRTASEISFSGRTIKAAVSSDKLGPALIEDVPGVENYMRIFDLGMVARQLVRFQDRSFYTRRFMFVDSSFFSVFSYKLLEGNSSSALSVPYSIVITKSAALEYFGNRDPVGQMVQLEQGDTTLNFTVTGVAADPPSNSSLQFQFLGSFSTLYTNWWAQDFTIGKWGSMDFYTFILLSHDQSVGNLTAKLMSFAEQHLKGNSELDGMNVSIILQPLKDIHLLSRLDFDFPSGVNIQTLYILSAIALFLLFLACINFMNLSTAKYVKRSKEISVRKVLGAERTQLISQFLGESLITTLLATVLGLVLVELLAPYAKGLTGVGLSLHGLNGGVIAMGFVAATVVTGLLAGIYPAVFLSSMEPLSIFKRTAKSVNLGDAVRKFLVVFQFTVSIALIVCAIVVENQMSYIQKSNLGFDKNNLVVISLCRPLWQADEMSRFDAYRNEITRNPNVISTTASYGYPGGIFMKTGFLTTGKDSKVMVMNWVPVDSEYINVLGLHMKAGVPFSEAHTRNAVIINESAQRELGLNKPVGRELLTHMGLGKVKIVGVVRDFNYQSLRDKIDPLVILDGRQNQYQFLICRIAPRNYKATLNFLSEKWQELYPAYPFDYSFLDADLAKLYVNDGRFGGVVNGFAGLAIFIACLGLFGLASFSVEERTKEIGIRKVLGASVTGIIKLMSKEFVKLVLVANMIAWPLAYFFMTRWLQGFAYRTAIGIWIFIMAGAIALVVALITVGAHAIKAATANPVESLRYE